MKKLIPILILLGGAATGFSQGTVTFQNSVTFQTVDPSGGGHLVYDVNSPIDPVNGARLLGSQYVAELYAGTSAGSLSPIAASASRFRNTSTAASNRGKWNTFTVSGGLNDPTAIPGATFGDTVFLQVKVWDWNANGGTTVIGSSTFEGKTTGNYGTSAVFTYKVPPAGDLFAGDYFMENLQGFALVPEPSAIALGIMGVAGLLLIRRRK